MKHVSSKEFSEMLKQHKQETKVAHKKKLYNKITKEVKNLSMENNDRRKILNSYQRFLKKQSGGKYFNPKIGEQEYNLEKVQESDYIKDIKLLNDVLIGKTLFINLENGSYYLKKIKALAETKESFIKTIQNGSTGIMSYNALAYLIDFLNYWMRYVKKNEDVKNELESLLSTLEQVGFNKDENQVPDDFYDTLIFDITNINNSNEKKNLCALDNILSILTFEKQNQAYEVNFNFIQDMSYYLTNEDLKKIIQSSIYKQKYESLIKSYMQSVLQTINLLQKPTEIADIKIYNKILEKSRKISGSSRKKGTFIGSETMANTSAIQYIPKQVIDDVKKGLKNLKSIGNTFQKNIDLLYNKLPKGGGDIDKFNANAVKALYHEFDNFALLKGPIEEYYNILNNHLLIEKIENVSKINNTTGNPLGKFVEQKKIDGKLKSFLSDVIFSKIAIGAYDDPALPNKLTKSAYQGWKESPSKPTKPTKILRKVTFNSKNYIKNELPVPSKASQTNSNKETVEPPPGGPGLGTTSVATGQVVTPVELTETSVQKLRGQPIFKEGNKVHKKNNSSWMGEINGPRSNGKYLVQKKNDAGKKILVPEEINENNLEHQTANIV